MIKRRDNVLDRRERNVDFLNIDEKKKKLSDEKEVIEFRIGEDESLRVLMMDWGKRRKNKKLEEGELKGFWKKIEEGEKSGKKIIENGMKERRKERNKVEIEDMKKGRSRKRIWNMLRELRNKRNEIEGLGKLK